MHAIINTLYTEYDDKMLHKMNIPYTKYDDKMLHKNASYNEHPVYNIQR